MRHHRHAARRGFTLVELLVSAALAILIMAVLSTAFSKALESLSTLKSLGGLAERLRTTHNLLNEDLSAQHFDGAGTTGVPALSDLRYDLLAAPGSTAAAPPTGGFVFLRQGNGSKFEGLDQDAVFSTRGDGADGHVLGLTVRRVGRRPDQLFTVDLTGVSAAVQALFFAQSLNDVPIQNTTTFVGEWGEVYWFLGNPVTLDGITNYTLYRRVRALTPRAIDNIPAADAALLSATVSLRPSTATPGAFVTNTLDSIRNPINRLYAAPNTAPTPIPSTDAKYGDDIVMTNVLSFEVKAFWTQQGPQWQTNATTVYAAPPASRAALPSSITAATIPGTNIRFQVPAVPPGAVPNVDWPFDDLPELNQAQGSPNLPENINPAYAGQRVFDTWTTKDQAGNAIAWNTPGSPNSIPFRARVQGVMVKVRAFEVKNKMTRQSTLIVKL